MRFQNNTKSISNVVSILWNIIKCKNKNCRQLGSFRQDLRKTVLVIKQSECCFVFQIYFAYLQIFDFHTLDNSWWWTYALFVKTVTAVHYYQQKMWFIHCTTRDVKNWRFYDAKECKFGTFEFFTVLEKIKKCVWSQLTGIIVRTILEQTS